MTLVTFMSEAKTPSSPGSSGADSRHSRCEHDPLQMCEIDDSRGASTRNGDFRREGQAFRPKNGHSRSALPESWTPALDSRLMELLFEEKLGERDAISSIQASYPELKEELIWSRIVYLGLTDRKRAPYSRHEWTVQEDQILCEEYGRSRASSRNAIEKILAVHPGLVAGCHRLACPCSWVDSASAYTASALVSSARPPPSFAHRLSTGYDCAAAQSFEEVRAGATSQVGLGR